MFQACRDLASAVTAHANLHNMTFPYIRTDNFEVYANEARRRAALELITLNPWLPDAPTVQAFNAYSMRHNMAWQQESIQEHVQLNPAVANKSFPFVRYPLCTI